MSEVPATDHTQQAASDSAELPTATADSIAPGDDVNDTAPTEREAASDEPAPLDSAAPGVATADPAHLHYEGATCVYTDPTSQAQYEWDASSSQWQARSRPVDQSEDYEWDAQRKAWFPKVDADFLARYQMSYDFSDPEAKRRQEALEAAKQAERDKAQAALVAKQQAPVPAEPAWFEPDSAHNAKVYISGLPLDVTETELAELMAKCGVVARDESGKLKLKLYTEPGEPTRLKGDALCTYLKVESVALALTLLDGSELRGKVISVARATFQMKGSYDPSLKPKKKRRKDKDKARKQQESLFDWRPDRLRGERAKHERTVVVSNLFEPRQFEQDVSLVLEFTQDLREECAKCGTVRKVVLYDRHPEGVATVTFEDAAEADVCIRLLNLRWFGQRRITAQTWDGKTKYKVAETEEEKQARLSKWDSFLVAEEAEKAQGHMDESAVVLPGNALDKSAENLQGNALDKSAENLPGNALDKSAENLPGNALDKPAENLPGNALDKSAVVLPGNAPDVVAANPSVEVDSPALSSSPGISD